MYVYVHACVRHPHTSESTMDGATTHTCVCLTQKQDAAPTSFLSKFSSSSLISYLLMNEESCVRPVRPRATGCGDVPVRPQIRSRGLVSCVFVCVCVCVCVCVQVRGLSGDGETKGVPHPQQSVVLKLLS